MSDETRSRALGIVRRTLQENAAEFSDDVALLAAVIDELDIDSLGKLEMVMELEKEFGLLLNEAEIAGCRSVGDLVSIVGKACVEPS